MKQFCIDVFILGRGVEKGDRQKFSQMHGNDTKFFNCHSHKNSNLNKGLISNGAAHTSIATHAQTNYKITEIFQYSEFIESPAWSCFTLRKRAK